MISADRARPPHPTDSRFNSGIEDAAIIPLVTAALAVKKLSKAALTLLINIIDVAFPMLLQVMRFPLFSLRILGDGLAALLKGVVRFLPVGGARREAWREFVSRQWAWLRQKISYKAFEEAVHHAFESGMAWVFRTCRTLTPRAALLVLLGAVLWLPISFGVATFMHAVLIAKATVLPAWMQLLHPVATIIAKSKLLVLPVYPASWPQAKAHPLVQTMNRLWRYLASLYLVRKMGHRFQQAEHASARIAAAVRRAASVVGLTRLRESLLAGLNASIAWIARALRVVAMRLVAGLAAAPLLGTVVRRYEMHYDEANREPAEKFSERTKDFFGRWSVKFTVEYYEAKDREQAAKGQSGT
ncbi:MAG: hypothetical protein ACRECO_01235 [Xanthobacteraceae bacterium]